MASPPPPRPPPSPPPSPPLRSPPLPPPSFWREPVAVSDDGGENSVGAPGVALPPGAGYGGDLLAPPPPEGDSGALPLWLLVVVAIVALAILGVLLFAFVRRKRRHLEGHLESVTPYRVSLVDDNFEANFNTLYNFSGEQGTKDGSMGDMSEAGSLQDGALGDMSGAGGLAQLALAHRRQSEVDRSLNRAASARSETECALDIDSTGSESMLMDDADLLTAPGLLMEDDIFFSSEGVEQMALVGDGLEAGDRPAGESVTVEVDELAVENFVTEAEAMLQIVIDADGKHLDPDSLAAGGAETGAVRDKLAQITELVRQRRAARARGKSVEHSAELDLVRHLSDVKSGLNSIEERSAAANKGDEWNNSLMEQIARVRKNMRHIERADLCKIKWQNAATTAMVTSLAGRIKRAAAGNYDHRGSVVNPLYNGGT